MSAKLALLAAALCLYALAAYIYFPVVDGHPYAYDEADYMWATERLADMAKRHANGRIVSMLEGGYDLTALAKSVAVHVKTLMDVGA